MGLGFFFVLTLEIVLIFFFFFLFLIKSVHVLNWNLYKLQLIIVKSERGLK